MVCMDEHAWELKLPTRNVKCGSISDVTDAAHRYGSKGVVQSVTMRHTGMGAKAWYD